MAVADGRSITVVKDMGLVPNVFNERTLGGLPGHFAIGHTRYSTTGSSTWRNAQPVYREAGGVHFALGHNGNLTNTETLADAAGMLPGTVGERQRPHRRAAGAARSSSRGRTSPAPSSAVLPSLRGAFSLVLIDQGRVIGGARPQRLPAAVPRPAWTAVGCVASESPALDIVGAHLVRELEPGEMVGHRRRPAPGRSTPSRPSASTRRCASFEFVYFARPDAELYGRSVAAARVRMGEQLAEQAPIPPDLATPPRPTMVMPVPESGRPRRAGLRPDQRHPLRRRAREEPLHRPDLHRPQPGAAQPRRPPAS